MQKLKRFFDYFEVHMMVVLMSVFMLNIFSQVFCRVVFNYPLFFAEELSRYAFLWMVFLGLSYATLHDKHIRVSILVERLPLCVQRVIDIFIQALTAAVFVWVFVTSLKFLPFCGVAATSALRIPKSIVSLILPISSALVIIRSLQKLAATVKAMAGRGVREETT